MCQRPACLLIGCVSTPKKKKKDWRKQQSEQCTIWDRCWADIHACHEYVAALAFIALPVLFLYAGGAFGAPPLKLKTGIESLFMSLEVGLVLVSTSLQTLPLWSVAIPQTHLRRPLLRPLGGKDNEFLCQVEEGDSPCFQKYNRQHWLGAGDRGQSSLKGQICYREWTCSGNVLLQRESFAFIYIEVDELIVWLEITLHLSWISPEAYCYLPDSNFLYNYKIMRLLIMSQRFEINVINGRLIFYRAGAN